MLVIVYLAHKLSDSIKTSIPTLKPVNLAGYFIYKNGECNPKTPHPIETHLQAAHIFLSSLDGKKKQRTQREALISTDLVFKLFRSILFDEILFSLIIPSCFHSMSR